MGRPDIDWSDTNWPLLFATVGCLASIGLALLLNYGRVPVWPCGLAWLIVPIGCLLCGAVARYFRVNWPLAFIPLLVIATPFLVVIGGCMLFGDCL